MVDEEPLRECATSESLFIIHLLVKIHVSNMKFPSFFLGTKGNSLIGEAVWNGALLTLKDIAKYTDHSLSNVSHLPAVDQRIER